MTHVAVITAAPGWELSDAEIERLRDALDGAEPRRLSPNAAEIPCEAGASATAERADVNVIKAEGRKKRLLIADMDSTMIPVECIDEIAEFAGVREQVAAITEPAMRGELSFEEALHARVALLEGFAAEDLADVYRNRISLNPGARTLVQTMQANAAHTALVSGGFTFFTERVAKAAGFDEHRANTLAIAAGYLTGKVIEPVLGREAKVAALTEITDALGISHDHALAVGDGANDLDMIEAAGLGVAFRAKPVLAKAADARIRHGDLTALLYLQGYTVDDFVTD